MVITDKNINILCIDSHASRGASRVERLGRIILRQRFLNSRRARVPERETRKFESYVLISYTLRT